MEETAGDGETWRGASGLCWEDIGFYGVNAFHSIFIQIPYMFFFFKIRVLKL